MALILILEDDQNQLYLMRMSLEQHHHEIIWRHNAINFIEAVHDIAPDLVIMDLKIPGGDGVELLEMLKTNPELSHIPVMILTAIGLLKTRSACEALGCDAYYVKPINSQDLLRAVEEIVGRAV